MRRGAATIGLMSMMALTVAGQSQTPRPIPPPSPLEAFAARPTARAVVFEEIGRLETTEARAVVTAVAYLDATATPSSMAGVRVDLERLAPADTDRLGRTWSARGSRDAIYIEREWLERVRDAMAEITTSMSRSAYWQGSSRGMMGAREFWDGYKDVYSTDHSRRFNAAAYRWNGTEGLTISGFWFEDRTPAEFESLLTRAIARLTRTPS